MQLLKIAVPCFFILLISCKKECDCPAPECTPELTSGLMAYYPFNGNANDESGNGNNGVPKNGAGFSSDFLGRPNRAATFDGNDDYIMVSDNGKLNSSELSVSMMLMVNTTNRRHAFFGRNDFNTATAVTWGFGQSLDQTNKFDFIVKDNAENCSTAHEYDPNSILSSSETMVAGRWYHIILTFGEGVQNMYIDGQLRGTRQRNFQTLKQCSFGDFLIGGWWKNDIISMDGKMDEIRIYDRVLSECERDKLSEVFKE